MKIFLGPKQEKMQTDFEQSEFSENHDLNITEGEEFLDDSIRMIDQPLMEASLPNDIEATENTNSKT